MPRQRVQSVLPKGWPADQYVTYLRAPIHSNTLSNSQLAEIQRQDIPRDDINSTVQIVRHASISPSPVQIRKIKSSQHPADGQHGLFATEHLKPSAFIIVYLGYVHSESDANSDSDYDLSLDRSQGISVDATKMGNESRFINDYRGIRQEGPNAEFRDCWLEIDSSSGISRQKVYEKCIGVFVLSEGKSGKRKAGIAKGEEILVSYGKGFWQERASSVAG